MKNLTPRLLLAFLLFATVFSNSLATTTALARIDQDPFWQMFKAETIPEKKAIWFTLTHEQKTDAIRMHVSWGSARIHANPDQVEFLVRYSDAWPDITPDQLKDLEAEASTLFTPDQSQLLFGSIGPYRVCNVFLARPLRVLESQNSCPCSVGSYFNMSCSGDCSTANGRCTTTTSGCGFGWGYGCDGFCQAG